MDPFEYYRQLHPVKQYVRSHISEPITLGDIAQQADLSKAHFSRVFHRHTGMRFQDWLLCQRVEYANKLLSANDMTITQVAFAAGFGSISTFERAFKKHEGVTPSEFRRKKREELALKRKQTPSN